MAGEKGNSIQVRYSIGTVARKTGLKPNLVRAWERRYGAIQPGRTSTNRRYYSEVDLKKLRLLKRATDAGHRIGQIAPLSLEQLQRIVASEYRIEDATDHQAGSTRRPEEHLSFALRAVESLSPADLETSLDEATVDLGRFAVLKGVLIPLIHRVGDAWQEGSLRIANEHMASVVLRSCLQRFQGTRSLSSESPMLIVATPSGQHHELGSLLVASVAAVEDWRILYLGANLPAEEIAGTARQKGARAVALSIVYPPDDRALSRELRQLAKLLRDETKLIVGGRAAGDYRRTLVEINATEITDLDEFRLFLRQIRSQPEEEKAPSG